MVLRYQCFGGTFCFCLGCKSDSSILKLETATLFAVLEYMYSATQHHIPKYLSLIEH